MPRRSKRLDKSVPDQAMTSQENSAAEIKTEEIEDMDASKNAEVPIKKMAQKAIRRKIAKLPSIPILFLKDKERAARPAVMYPQHLECERKFKKKNNSTEANTAFDERRNQLLQFKEEFGPCNVPQKFANNPSLGKWCGQMRAALQENPKGNGNTAQSLTRQDRASRRYCFQWQGVDYDEAFEKRCHELI